MADRQHVVEEICCSLKSYIVVIDVVPPTAGP